MWAKEKYVPKGKGEFDHLQDKVLTSKSERCKVGLLELVCQSDAQSYKATCSIGRTYCGVVKTPKASVVSL